MSHRTICHTGQYVTQDNMSHRTICHTGQYVTQDNMSHRTICHTGQYVTQDNMSHRTICHTGQYVTQDKMSHRTKCHTGQNVTQDKMSHRTKCHTGQNVTQDKMSQDKMSQDKMSQDKMSPGQNDCREGYSLRVKCSGSVLYLSWYKKIITQQNCVLINFEYPLRAHNLQFHVYKDKTLQSTLTNRCKGGCANLPLETSFVNSDDRSSPVQADIGIFSLLARSFSFMFDTSMKICLIIWAPK